MTTYGCWPLPRSWSAWSTSPDACELKSVSTTKVSGLDVAGTRDMASGMGHCRGNNKVVFLRRSVIGSDSPLSLDITDEEVR